MALFLTSLHCREEPVARAPLQDSCCAEERGRGLRVRVHQYKSVSIMEHAPRAQIYMAGIADADAARATVRQYMFVSFGRFSIFSVLRRWLGSFRKIVCVCA